MRNGSKVFDADAHVVYAADLWSRYLGVDLISDEAERRILWDNALDFYRLPEAMIPEQLR